MAAREGASGNRSIVRNRYSSGQVLKSDARDGDSDPTIASGKAATVSVMPETLEPSPDNFWQARLYLSRAGAGAHGHSQWIRPTGQMIKKARPMIDDLGIGPNTRLSLELHRLSPIMKYRPDGTVTGAKSVVPWQAGLT